MGRGTQGPARRKSDLCLSPASSVRKSERAALPVSPWRAPQGDLGPNECACASPAILHRERWDHILRLLERDNYSAWHRHPTKQLPLSSATLHDISDALELAYALQQLLR